MAETDGTQPEFQENPLIAELLARGAENARVLQGFIGPSRDADHITLYQSLDRLGDTVEIRRDDVLHSVSPPSSALGAVMVWVNHDAKLHISRTRDDFGQATKSGTLHEMAKGRLRMRLPPHASGDVCTSRCNVCHSECIMCSCLTVR